MVALAIVCVILFAFALAALSITNSQQDKVLSKGWDSMSSKTKEGLQKLGNCCGYKTSSNDSSSADHPNCNEVRP